MGGVAPTIKGIFVMSHVKALRREKGDEAVAELEKRFGRPVRYSNMEDVPVRDEIAIIEHALDILRGDNVPKELRAEEAGKLHFVNFATTPLARLVLPFFTDKFKLLMMQANNLAGHVFHGVHFTSEEASEREVRITLENNDYPLEHFKGFFEAWLAHVGLKGSVTAEDKGDDRYVYTLKWD